MRDLKFRAYWHARKEIYPVSFVNFDKGIITLSIEKTINGEWYRTISLDRVELLQYTGLKDNEGIEIYEGNIVECKDGEGSFTGVVTYSPFGWYVKNKNDCFEMEYFSDESKGVSNCTVVGSYVEDWKRGIDMKKFLIEESGYYKIRMEVEALNEDDAIDKIYGYLPRFIDVERDDREVTELSDD